MCRALLYLGEPVLLDDLLYQPDSALVRQSYMPQMRQILNLAGFGMRAWNPSSREPERPWAYGSTDLPVFDRNLKSLAEKVEATNVLAHVRGVPYSTAVEISLANVHPFQFPGSPVALAHNGDLARFAELRPALARHVPLSLAQHVRGTTDSEWIYALVLAGLRNPFEVPSGEELVAAIVRAIDIIQRERETLGIDLSSDANLFVADGTQIVTVRNCFDFGRYDTVDPSRLHDTNLRFVSLWYTLGREYGLHDGEWTMIGGADAANSILVASEPLTRNIAAWVEVPEYAVLHARIDGGRPSVNLHYLD